MEEQRKNSYDPNEDIVDRMWKRSKNSINLVIVVCNILVFLAVTLTGGTESSRHMMDCGAAYAPLIESGEYYRLFTSMFLHFGIQHLINNMLLLLFLGDYLERAVGKIRYLVIYLGGGLVGNLCSYLHELFLMKTGEAPAVSAGASGAIFSAVGAMLVLLAFRKGRLEDLTVQAIAEGLLQQGIELVILGSGESQYENFFNELCARNPGRVGVYIGFNAKLAQEIYAGADIFLMPSRSEPCGLAQMVSCRYGTIPVIRETGGLKDSIRDSGDGYGNGFTFANYNAHELYEACWRAKEGYWQKDGWPVLVKRAMECDFSWSNSPRATRACITRSSTSGNR